MRLPRLFYGFGLIAPDRRSFPKLETYIGDYRLIPSTSYCGEDSVI